jgi:TonB family protein
MKIKNKYLLSVLVFGLIIITIIFVTQDNLNIKYGTNPNQYYLSDSSETTKQQVKEQLADEMPKLIYQAMPKYPKKAQRERIECVVYVRILINKNGIPVKSEIMKREGGSKEFEDSVTIAAMNSKFVPAKIDGASVETYVVIPYKFKLK